MGLKLYVISSGTFPDSIIQDDNLTAPVGYTDKTNIVDVANSHYAQITLSYEYHRNWIKALFLAKDTINTPQQESAAFPLLTPEEKSVVCKYILMPHYYRIMFHGEGGDFENWEVLVKRTEGVPYDLLEGRSLVYENMRLAVSEFVRTESWVYGDYYANLTHAQNLFRDVFVMKELYVSSNDFEFKDFITSTGTYDETTGLKSKPYYLEPLEALLIFTYYQNVY